MSSLRLANVAARLPALTLAARSFSDDERAYLAFYGLDFCGEFPGLLHSFGCVESGEEKLAAQVWQQPAAAPTILIVHGYFDHVGLFGHLIRHALAGGFNVVGFDLPGHGLSSGEAAVTDDFGQYRQALADMVGFTSAQLGQPHVIGQSTGAGVLVDYLLRAGASVQKVVLLAPLVRPVGWWWIGPARFVLHRFVDAIPRKFSENSGDPDFLEFLSNDPLQSKIVSMRWIAAMRRWQKSLSGEVGNSAGVLLVQGDADATVDWRYNVKRVQELIPGVQVEYVAGARHHLPNESAQLRGQVFALIDDFIGHSPVPAGRETRGT